jgi:hypothetical protein
MKENANKHIDQFVDKVMKTSKLETPSFNFTAKVMSQITETSRSTVTVYKPLISKTVWGILLVLGAVLVVFSIFSKDNTTLGWFDKLDISKVFNVFSGIEISQTTMYSLLMFGVMLFIQIPILKHYFNKRFEA